MTVCCAGVLQFEICDERGAREEHKFTSIECQVSITPKQFGPITRMLPPRAISFISFSSIAPSPFKEAKTLETLSPYKNHFY